MSTRGTVGFRIGGEDKLTYNHSDSYPSWLGVEILKQIKTMKKKGWASVKAKVAAIRLVAEDAKPTPADIKKFGHLANLGVGAQSPDDWYCLLRDFQGDLKGCLTVGIMTDGSAFINESLFCEWGYVINLDSMKLEVYKGFQSAPHAEGRYGKNLDPKAKEAREAEGRDFYYPCALLVEFDLRRLPSEVEFIAAIQALLPDEDE